MGTRMARGAPGFAGMLGWAVCPPESGVSESGRAAAGVGAVWGSAVSQSALVPGPARAASACPRGPVQG